MKLGKGVRGFTQAVMQAIRVDVACTCSSDGNGVVLGRATRY